MNHDHECSIDILLYLDNALAGEELENFRAHLASCSICRERLKEERALSLLLRETRPLYLASRALRARVAAIATEPPARPAENPRRKTHMQNWTRCLLNCSRPVRSWKLLVALTLVLLLGLVLIPEVVKQVRATDYTEAAAQLHRSYLNGALPLQCRSRSPEAVTAWFAGKTLFHFQLPVSQSWPNRKTVYSLAGARLVDYHGSSAALVAYETPTEKISLVVAPSESAVVAGGVEVRSGNLTFHYRNEANFDVITWTNHGLAYALVSPRTGSPQHSCLVCHQDMADQNPFAY